MMQLFIRFFSLLLLLGSVSLMGCSPELSEEETPMVVSDEDETEVQEFDPENP